MGNFVDQEGHNKFVISAREPHLLQAVVELLVYIYYDLNICTIIQMNYMYMLHTYQCLTVGPNCCIKALKNSF